ncbi:angiotensin-converting enzyme-like [Physella acuta]|uniref:angiotensin-converting enzyme-like n=1 Tax=Physella acuta TaxID=109671 RepID=UPI0027DCCBB1|nr:angiotensin-converting enzyme-like [Physella acuta]
MLRFLILTCGLVCWGQKINTGVKDFLENFDYEIQKLKLACQSAEWNYKTNITDYNKKLRTDQQMEYSRFRQEAYKNASRFNLTLLTPIQKRQFSKIMDIDTDAQQNKTKLARLQEVLKEMIFINKDGVQPGYVLRLKLTKDDVSINFNFFSVSENDSTDSPDAKLKKLYSEYVSLSNEAIRFLGHSDYGAYWRSYYEDANFKDNIRALYDQVLPLYKHFHAYARRKLKAIHVNDTFPASGHIPENLYWYAMDLEPPISGKTSFDIAAEMVKQNYTAMKIFQIADDFFKSLGMISVPEEFWRKSLMEKPKDGRKVDCFVSAWDFGNGKDFRIKQCTEMSENYFSITHREMGYIQYFLQYKNQPFVFRGGANPGFLEAVGNTISLSVETQEHLKSINLIKEVVYDKESTINFLMAQAQKTITFIPFIYIADLWRWEVFSGETTKENYNRRWWEYRCKYEGLSPYSTINSSHFDPGTIDHITANVPLMSHFVGVILKFQFYKALCDISGYTGQLHRCDIYKSKQAGAKLSEMLRLGSSKPWPEAMYVLTGQYKMDAKPLIDYFKPLLDYLVKENGNDYGWKQQCPSVVPET